MKFGKGRCELRNPSPDIERLPCDTGIDNEKAIGNPHKSRRSKGFTKRFGKNLANREIAYLRTL